MTNLGELLKQAQELQAKIEAAKIEASKPKTVLDPKTSEIKKAIEFNKGFVNFGYKQGCNGFLLLSLYEQGKLGEFLEKNRAQIIKAQQNYVESLA